MHGGVQAGPSRGEAAVAEQKALIDRQQNGRVETSPPSKGSRIGKARSAERLRHVTDPIQDHPTLGLLAGQFQAKVESPFEK